MLALPEDLLLALLSEWLPASLRDLSALEVAYCTRASRSCWLEVIRRVRIEQADAAKSTGNFLIWLNDRGVLVKKLRVFMGKEGWESLDGLAVSLRTTSLECCRDPNSSKPNNHSQHIRALLSFFPCLTALDVDCRYLVDDAFPDLSPRFPPLRQLSLRNCWAVDMSDTVYLLSAASGTLEELHCDIFDEPMVVILAEHCRTLMKLSCSFRSDATAASIAAVCANNQTLNSVAFDGKIMTNELILSILSSCSGIREIRLGEHCVIEPSELLSSQAVHALDYFSMRSCVFRLFPCDSSRSQRCCEIVVKGHQDHEFIRHFCADTSISIRAITFSRRDEVKISAEELRLLADAHGHSLEKCELCLFYDNEQADVQYFLSHCPNMVELSLTNSGTSPLIDNADMRNLPLWCPRIAKLKLLECADKITDDSFSFALERWATNGVTAIDLQGCLLLTDAVLPVIARCCPQLHYLGVRGIKKISKKAFLQFVISASKNKAFLSLDYASHCLIADELDELKKRQFELWKKLKVALLYYDTADSS